MVVSVVAAVLATLQSANSALLLDASREDKSGWVVAHVRGTPAQVGYQHGYLLAREIDDCLREARFEIGRGKADPDRAYLESRAERSRLFRAKIPTEYIAEMAGIAKGMSARGYKYNFDDVLLLNSAMEWSYYESFKAGQKSAAGGHCSAFVCTGGLTKDGKIVMGHSNWASFLTGERCNAILDITPQKGHRILMDATPGLIESGDDFAINSAGVMLCETTIAGFHGFDVNGTPEFVRMRLAAQYASNLDDVVRLLRTGNNGGYASTWLMGDRKTNEIGKLELGLKNVVFHRSSQGAFYGANYPEDEKLTAEECDQDLKLGTNSAADRRRRWMSVFSDPSLRVDADRAKAFLADHHDELLGTDTPSYGTLCGHGDADNRPTHVGTMAYAPAGAVQAKVVTATLAARMQFWARMGRPCGQPFVAASFLTDHPEYAWQKPFLRDMPSRPWVTVSARRKRS